MTICFSHPEFHASVADVRRTAVALNDARARASREVDHLLGAWDGAAAAAFAEAWSVWLASSADVASSLAGLADSLALFQSDISTCDATTASTLSALESRLS